jgi:membrane protein DedA with SNARE-associated domain
MLAAAVSWLVNTIGQLGYAGIVCLMFLESSFFPFPSEVVIPPAGYLASKGQMNIAAVIFMGILGSILGALFNYWLSLKVGRPFFRKYGKYFLVSPRSLDKADAYFRDHGHISTLIGRLLPGIRQYISLPAGMARMNLFQFSLFTALGSGIWVIVLAVVGYAVGSNEELLNQYLHRITIAVVAVCVVLGSVYFAFQKKKKNKETGQNRSL